MSLSCGTRDRRLRASLSHNTVPAPRTDANRPLPDETARRCAFIYNGSVRKCYTPYHRRRETTVGTRASGATLVERRLDLWVRAERCDPRSCGRTSIHTFTLARRAAEPPPDGASEGRLGGGLAAMAWVHSGCAAAASSGGVTSVCVAASVSVMVSAAISVCVEGSARGGSRCTFGRAEPRRPSVALHRLGSESPCRAHACTARARARGSGCDAAGTALAFLAARILPGWSLPCCDRRWDELASSRKVAARARCDRAWRSFDSATVPRSSFATDIDAAAAEEGVRRGAW